MRIVLDTNVLVSGLLKPYGPPAQLVQMTSSGLLRLCYDTRILSEYQEVLARPKFGFQESHVAAFLEQIQYVGEHVSAEPLSEPLPDSDDEPFLEVALSGNARCLVTGNLKDYPHDKRQGVSVVSPKEMIRIYRMETQTE